MLLMMATYGLGAAEVLGLRLEDLDWQRRHTASASAEDGGPDRTAAIAASRQSYDCLYKRRASARHTDTPDFLTGEHAL